MKNFLLKRVSNDTLLILALSIDSIVFCLDEIANSPEIKHSEGTVVVDQIFAVGNSDDRFFSFKYKYGVLDIENNKLVPPEEDYLFRKASLELLRTIPERVSYSILTYSQRSCIDSNEVF